MPSTVWVLEVLPRRKAGKSPCLQEGCIKHQPDFKRACSARLKAQPQDFQRVEVDNKSEEIRKVCKISIVISALQNESDNEFRLRVLRVICLR